MSHHFAGAAVFTVSNINDTGTGSLRQAITDANNSADPTNSIVFNLSGVGPFTFSPKSTFPPITQPVFLDGTSQPGYLGVPLIQINGAGIGANGDGLLVSAGNSVIQGLAIYSCKRDGIRLSGLGNNTVKSCYLGTDATGTKALGNLNAGVYVFRSLANVIGGTDSGDRNVISANNHGVYIDDGTPPPIGGYNVLQGNYIGMTVTGLTALPNTNSGVYITQSPGNIIGGTTAGAGNVISGNRANGIYAVGAFSTNTVIQGNKIGRINGTLVGGMVGLVLHGISLALWH